MREECKNFVKTGVSCPEMQGRLPVAMHASRSREEFSAKVTIPEHELGKFRAWSFADPPTIHRSCPWQQIDTARSPDCYDRRRAWLWVQEMKFHASVHGENVIIDEGGKLASRKTSFCDGVVFFAKAVSIGTRYSILLPNTDESWNGGLRIGLSTKEPSAVQPVPKFTFPELTGEFWGIDSTHSG